MDSGFGRLYAVSPSSSTLAVFDIDWATGGIRQTGCFAAAPRAGCTVVPPIAGASDVAMLGEAVFVAGRDADAVAVFRITDGGLERAGCASPTLAGCAPAKALDAPVALGAAPGRFPFTPLLFVASRDSDAVATFAMTAGALQQMGCVQEPGGADGCTEGRALKDPAGIAVDQNGVVVASTGSNGLATLSHSGAPVGCITQGGSEGCRAADGLSGPSGVASFRGDVYVSAPGAGTVAHLRLGSDGRLTKLEHLGVPGGNGIALPPETFIADAPSYAGSHVYVASRALGSIASFARDRASGALSALPPTGPLRPGGGIEDVTLTDDDYDSTPVYAVGAGGVLVLSRNIPPDCGYGPPAPPPPVPTTPGGKAVLVPLHCYDSNHDALAFSVAKAPAHGKVTGFEPRTEPTGSDYAVYQPDAGFVGSDSFTINASDGGASTTEYLAVEVLPPGATGKGPHVVILDKRLRMDRKGRVGLRLRCPAITRITLFPADCRSTVEVRRGARRARKAATIRRGRVRRVQVRLPRGLQRTIRRSRRGVVVTVRVRARARGGAPVAEGPLGITAKRLRVRRTRPAS